MPRRKLSCECIRTAQSLTPARESRPGSTRLRREGRGDAHLSRPAAVEEGARPAVRHEVENREAHQVRSSLRFFANLCRLLAHLLKQQRPKRQQSEEIAGKWRPFHALLKISMVENETHWVL